MVAQRRLERGLSNPRDVIGACKVGTTVLLVVQAKLQTNDAVIENTQAESACLVRQCCVL